MYKKGTFYKCMNAQPGIRAEKQEGYISDCGRLGLHKPCKYSKYYVTDIKTGLAVERYPEGTDYSTIKSAIRTVLSYYDTQEVQDKIAECLKTERHSAFLADIQAQENEQAA